MKRQAASFLNLDLELRSSDDLSPLAKHLGKYAFILHNGKVKSTHLLCAEPLINGGLSRSIRDCTNYFLQVLETLPTEYSHYFHHCKSRVFDYGFDGGLEAKPLSVNISSGHIARISQLGIKIRLTVYPYRSEVDA
jgi:hypothetical protein